MKLLKGKKMYGKYDLIISAFGILPRCEIPHLWARNSCNTCRKNKGGLHLEQNSPSCIESKLEHSETEDEVTTNSTGQ